MTPPAYRKAYVPLFPKPKDKPRPVVPIKVMPDGREIIDTKTPEGNAEYHRRKWLMWERQSRRCCLEGFIKDCPGILKRGATTFEHENGRTAGKHDDRIEVGGIWLNGAAHLYCNQQKGSRRFDYNASLQARKSVTEA